MASTRAAARAAIAAWFAPPNVVGLNTIFPSFPLRIADAAYFAGTVPGTQSGAVAVVHIIRETETRVAMGGPTSGVKRADFECSLQVMMHSTLQTAEGATDDLDAVVNAIKVRLRADRTFGSVDVWQAGEHNLVVDYNEPRMTEKWIENWVVIGFELSQFLMGT